MIKKTIGWKKNEFLGLYKEQIQMLKVAQPQLKKCIIIVSLEQYSEYL